MITEDDKTSLAFEILCNLLLEAVGAVVSDPSEDGDLGLTGSNTTWGLNFGARVLRQAALQYRTLSNFESGVGLHAVNVLGVCSFESKDALRFELSYNATTGAEVVIMLLRKIISVQAYGWLDEAVGGVDQLFEALDTILGVAHAHATASDRTRAARATASIRLIEPWLRPRPCEGRSENT